MGMIEELREAVEKDLKALLNEFVNFLDHKGFLGMGSYVSGTDIDEFMQLKRGELDRDGNTPT